MPLCVLSQRLDQRFGLERFVHRLERKMGSWTRRRRGDRGAGRENGVEEIAGTADLSEEPFGELHLEFAVEPQQQLGAGQAIQRQIAIKVAVELHETRLDHIRMQLDNETADDL
jgi:hypothetical protein